MRQETLAHLNKVVDHLQRTAAQIRIEMNEVIATGDHVEIIKHFNDTRIAAELVKEARDALREMSDHLSHTVIPDVFDAVRERTGEKPPFTIEGVGRVSVTHRWSASIVDKEVGLQWLRDNDYGDIIMETVNSSTLAAFAKDLTENQGIDLPPEIFTVGTKPYTSITKAR